MNDNTIEQEIIEKGLTAPRVTIGDIEENIQSAWYFTAKHGVDGAVFTDVNDGPRPEALNLLTFCVIVLKNGFTVTGESACVSPENFDIEMGRKVARQNAVQKIWSLMGYELKERLSKGEF